MCSSDLWPADVSVPYGPVVCGRPDPVFEIGLEVLAALRDGMSRKKAIAIYGGLFRGEISAGKKAAPKWAKFALDDLKSRVDVELALLSAREIAVPDALGASRRLADLQKRADAAGLSREVGRMMLDLRVRFTRAEIAAQKAFLAMTDRKFGASESDRKAFLKKHRKSRIAKFARAHLWN